MVIGVSQPRVLSDTTNWSGSGAGTNYKLPSPNCCTNSSQQDHAEKLRNKEERWGKRTYLISFDSHPAFFFFFACRLLEEAKDRFYWTKNSQSPVGNCETAIFINSTSSQMSLLFMQVQNHDEFYFLLSKTNFVC